MITPAAKQLNNYITNEIVAKSMWTRPCTEEHLTAAMKFDFFEALLSLPTGQPMPPLATSPSSPGYYSSGVTSPLSAITGGSSAGPHARRRSTTSPAFFVMGGVSNSSNSNATGGKGVLGASLVDDYAYRGVSGNHPIISLGVSPPSPTSKGDRAGRTSPGHHESATGVTWSNHNTSPTDRALPRTISAISVQSEASFSQSIGAMLPVTEAWYSEEIERAVLQAISLVAGKHLHDINAPLTEARLQVLSDYANTVSYSSTTASVADLSVAERCKFLQPGMTPLIASVAMGLDRVAEAMLKELRASAHLQNALTGETAVHMACKCGRSVMLQRLLLPLTPYWLLLERSQPQKKEDGESSLSPLSGVEPSILTPAGIALKHHHYNCIGAILDYIANMEQPGARAREILLTSLGQSTVEVQTSQYPHSHSQQQLGATGSTDPGATVTYVDSPSPSPNPASAPHSQPTSGRNLGKGLSPLWTYTSSGQMTAPAADELNILHVLCRRSHDPSCLALLERLAYHGPSGLDRSVVLAKDCYGRIPAFYCTTPAASKLLGVLQNGLGLSPGSSFSSVTSAASSSPGNREVVHLDKYNNTPLHCLKLSARPLPAGDKAQQQYQQSRANNTRHGSSGSSGKVGSYNSLLDEEDEAFHISNMSSQMKDTIIRRLVQEATSEDDFAACLTSLYTNFSGVPVLHSLMADSVCANILVKVINERFCPSWQVIAKLCASQDTTPRGNTLLHTCANEGYYDSLQVLLQGAAVPLNRVVETFTSRAEQVARLLTALNSDGLPPMFLTAHCPQPYAAVTASVLLLPCLELLKSAKERKDKRLIHAMCSSFATVLSCSGAVLYRTNILHYLCQSGATDAFRGWRKTARAMMKHEASGIGNAATREPSDYPLQAALAAMALSRDHTTNSTAITTCIYQGNVVLLGFVIRSILACTSCQVLLEAFAESNKEGELSSFFSVSPSTIDGDAKAGTPRKAPRFSFPTPPPDHEQLEVIHSLTPPEELRSSMNPFSQSFAAFTVPTWEAISGRTTEEDGAVAPKNSLYTPGPNSPVASLEARSFGSMAPQAGSASNNVFEAAHGEGLPLALNPLDVTKEGIDHFHSGGGVALMDIGLGNRASGSGYLLNATIAGSDQLASSSTMTSASVTQRKSLMLSLLEKFFILSAKVVRGDQQIFALIKEESEARTSVEGATAADLQYVEEHHPISRPISRFFDYSALCFPDTSLSKADINVFRRPEYLSDAEFAKILGVDKETFRGWTEVRQIFVRAQLKLTAFVGGDKEPEEEKVKDALMPLASTSSRESDQTALKDGERTSTTPLSLEVTVKEHGEERTNTPTLLREGLEEDSSYSSPPPPKADTPPSSRRESDHTSDHTQMPGPPGE